MLKSNSFTCSLNKLKKKKKKKKEKKERKKEKKKTPHAMGNISNNDYGSRLILQLWRMTVDVAGRLEIIVPR